MGEFGRHLARGRACSIVLVLAVGIVSAVASWFPLRLPALVGVRWLSWALRLAPRSAWRSGSLCRRHVRRYLWCLLLRWVGYLEGRRRTLLVRDMQVGWKVGDDAVCVFVCV
jgi:hypothetical protein